MNGGGRRAEMLRRRGTTIEQKSPAEEERRRATEARQEGPMSEQRNPYGSEERREAPVSAPPRGNGHAVREAERMAGREEMLQPAPISMGRYLANWFTLLLGSVLVVGETVLGLRLFFKLVSADNTNGFVKLIYHITGQMIRPFDGVWSVHTVTGGGIFEPAVIIALVLFLVASVLAIWVVRSLATLRSWGSAFIPR
jgi:hypothetical protein